MSLPILTTVDDIRNIVEYLKTKPTGASLAEARAVVKKQVLDPRKLSGYVFWGVITKDADRLKLAPRGWDLARRSRTEAEVFVDILGAIKPYRSVLEWVFHQKMESVTNVDVAVHWHEHHQEESGGANENTLKDQAVCFFHLSQAAGVGKLTIGRKGAQTRLDIDRGALEKFVASGPASPPWSAPESVEDVSGANVLDEPPTGEEVRIELPISSKTTEELPPAAAAIGLKVFISHGKNMEIVEQVETMLGMGDIAYEIAVAEESTAIPVPEKVFDAMRRCSAAIIVVSVEDGSRDSDNNFTINQNVLIEVGAAFVLYSRKVVLLWDKRIKVPSNLQGLYRCEFEGDELSWKAGMRLMKAIKEFKK